jgi:5-formyltetrahydrofolate cyclo-ligase
MPSFSKVRGGFGLDKRQLRAKAKEDLRHLTKVEKGRIEQSLYRFLFATSYWKDASCIGLTVSQAHEWNTQPIIEKAWEQNKRVSVPKCFPKQKLLVFYEITSLDQLECVYMDLLEPIVEKTTEVEKQDIDLLIVPGLVFDERGFRIGYGGGYYDRYMKNYPNTALSLVGVQQLVKQVPNDQYDIPVSHIVMNTGVLF